MSFQYLEFEEMKDKQSSTSKLERSTSGAQVKVVEKHGRTSSTLSLVTLGTSPAAEPSTQHASGQSSSVYPFH